MIVKWPAKNDVRPLGTGLAGWKVVAVGEEHLPAQSAQITRENHALCPLGAKVAPHPLQLHLQGGSEPVDTLRRCAGQAKLHVVSLRKHVLERGDGSWHWLRVADARRPLHSFDMPAIRRVEVISNLTVPACR